MNKEKDNIKLSKFLSYVLRHRPEKIEIVLDKNGWTNIEALIENSKSEIEFTLEELLEVVANCDKQRFSISKDGKEIRANQGHSTEVKLDFKEIAAPPVLYHGTVKEAIASIKKSGLKSMKRHHVHLSKDEVTASVVGARRGKPLILLIDAMKMQDEGFRFFISDNGVYLADSVPKKYIKNLDKF